MPAPSRATVLFFVHAVMAAVMIVCAYVMMALYLRAPDTASKWKYGAITVVCMYGMFLSARRAVRARKGAAAPKQQRQVRRSKKKNRRRKR